MSVSMNLVEIRDRAEDIALVGESGSATTGAYAVALEVAGLARLVVALCDVISLPAEPTPIPAHAPAAVAVDDEALVRGMARAARPAVPTEGVELTLDAFYEAEARAALAYLRSQGWGPRP